MSLKKTFNQLSPDEKKIIQNENKKKCEIKKLTKLFKVANDPDELYEYQLPDSLPNERKPRAERKNLNITELAELAWEAGNDVHCVHFILSLLSSGKFILLHIGESENFASEWSNSSVARINDYLPSGISIKEDRLEVIRNLRWVYYNNLNVGENEALMCELFGQVNKDCNKDVPGQTYFLLLCTDIFDQLQAKHEEKLRTFQQTARYFRKRKQDFQEANENKHFKF